VPDAAEPWGPSPARPRRRVRLAVVLAGIILAAALGTWVVARDSSPRSATVSSQPTKTAARGAKASGSYTLLDGTGTDLAALRGQPTLLWFIASGCASCAASIPVVASQLPTFAAARTRILALGLYGAFDNGRTGLGELASFGRTYAHSAFSDPTWTWAMASAGLTTAYDPGGVPDEYFLLDASGQTVYAGSVPVSTMGALLAHLRSLTGVRLPGASSAPAPQPVATLP
jgi:hypothetical protein